MFYGEKFLRVKIFMRVKYILRVKQFLRVEKFLAWKHSLRLKIFWGLKKVPEGLKYFEVWKFFEGEEIF